MLSSARSESVRRAAGEVHEPDEMSRRSSVSHASASSRVWKVSGALCSPWSGPVYRARYRLLGSRAIRPKDRFCATPLTPRV